MFIYLFALHFKKASKNNAAMENCSTLRKSVLKKSDLSTIKKAKKVTFCSTVKMFIGECNYDDDIKIMDSQLNCVEVNIVDKSSEDSLICADISKNDDCNATDFLVHKVIYENTVDDDDTDALSEEADESSILYENNTDDEGLQFVVHKVVDHEDDLIQQELELDDSDTGISYSEDIECNSDLIGKLSELSIENILTHDKIIAFIDQNTLSLSSLLKSHVNVSEINALPSLKNPVKDTVSTPSVSLGLKNTELVLSPPLQELSLDKIVKAHSDNVLSELEISPLNSIQETDSDSDLSSEGTMIMMTTEESEKNEQHIRESFLKYESMKKDKVETRDIIPSEFQASIKNAKVHDMLKRTDEAIGDSESSVSVSCNEKMNSNSNENIYFNSDLKPVAFVKETENFAIGSDYKSEPVIKVETSSFTNNPTVHCDTENNSLRSCEMRKTLTTKNEPCYWDKSLASVQIPKDVREWKIISSPEKNSKPIASNMDLNVNSSSFHGSGCFSLKLDKKSFDLSEKSDISHNLKSDELESFVHASKERVQRIRKRYLDKTQRKLGSSNSPVRGIRPRFSSTAEILQLMQKKNQPPLAAFNSKNHVSWPCVNTISNPGLSIQNREELTRMLACQSLPGDYSFQSSFSSFASEDSSSSTCDHDSVSSCPSIFFYERGVPEGASPPRSFSEDNVEHFSSEENPSSVVYFSMKV